MCEFLSFLATEKGFYFGDFYSHGGIETIYGLNPREYCECEWRYNGLMHLEIRGDNEQLRSFIRASIEAKYKDRAEFLGDYQKGGCAEGWFKDGEFHRKDGPAYVSYLTDWATGKVDWSAPTNVSYFIDGKPHRHDGPAYILNSWAYGEARPIEEKWYLKGKPYRKDGPANIMYREHDGEVELETFYNDWGRVSLYRKYYNGSISAEHFYDENGINYHREDGPAYTIYYNNGQVSEERYHIRGQIHREDGPAITHYNTAGRVTREEWYIDGKLHREGGPARIVYDRDEQKIVKEYWIDGRLESFIGG